MIISFGIVAFLISLFLRRRLMPNFFRCLCVVIVFFSALSSVAQEVDTAYVPFVVNVAATVKAEYGGNVLSINVAGGDEADTLKIPLGPPSSVMSSSRSVRNSAPVVTVNRRGNVTVNLPSQSYNVTDISLYSVNGRRILRSTASASQASKKHISRPNLVSGSYLLTVKGASGHSFSSRLTHSGGSLNINIEFGGDSFSSPVSPAALSKHAVAHALGDWAITVSATGYVDSSYTLNVVNDMNPVQNITLRIKPDDGECGDGDHFSPDITYGCFTDERDGTKYRTVTIGSQTWMAENLNFDVFLSRCYNTIPDSCAKYGRLYGWYTAMSLPAGCNSSLCASQVQSPHRGICPSGWHVPSDAEWNTLVHYVGGSSTASTKLKSTTGWSSGGNGTDDFGFSALPSGSSYGSNFSSAGSSGSWWSATEVDATSAWNRGMSFSHSNVIRSGIDKGFRYALRCVEDD
jgi:uncharacterized protein (TIGR02145 family)